MESWQTYLEKWREAELLDPATAERIRLYESEHAQSATLRWPMLLAIALGAVMLGAGVLLFVSAHWDQLSPSARFSLVLLLVIVFHVAGAVLEQRSESLAMALHGIGTVALGAGIFLAAQIFNLQEHWPGGIMLWAIGAAVAWIIRRDPVQAGLVAVLAPAWLAAEWIDATDSYNMESTVAKWLLLLAVTYLSALAPDREGVMRDVLAWIGGIPLIPAAVIAASPWLQYGPPVPAHLLWLGHTVGFALPLALALWLRGKSAWMNAVAALWIAALTLLPPGNSVLPYLWYAIASLGLIAWGLKERRHERIDLGVAGFGLTILAFYFSNVMDKLGRSASLISLGLLFLILGWGLERARRRLVASVKGGAA